MAGFEEQLAQLEKVVERLERGDLTLDQSVQLFEEGTRLSHSCKEQLEQAEGRIQVLVETRGGKMQAADLELESEDEDAANEDDNDLEDDE